MKIKRTDGGIKPLQIKLIISFMLGIIVSSITVYSAANIIASKKISYNNAQSNLQASNVQDAIDELYNNATNYEMLKDDMLNTIYPVGSIYISTSLSTTAQVATKLGGTWEVFGAGRTIISANSTYPINTTGGSVTHQHKYGLQYAGYYREVLMESVADAGVLNYSNDSSYTVAPQTVSIAASSATAIAANNSTVGTITGTTLLANRYTSIGNTGTASTLPPYITVYMYKRTA